MRNYIILNGKNSNTIQGLMIQSLAPITKPLIRTQVEEIDGRDGDIVTPLGYSSYDKTITIGLYGNYDVNEVIEYFNSNGIVTFSNEPDKYYKYQINAQIDFERLIRFKTATVTMHCQPFKYSTTEQPEIMSPTDELLSIPDWQQIKNRVTVSCTNGVISVSGTPTSATEFYMPITALALQAGSYTLTASANGQNPNNCSIRMIGTAPSDADSFGNRYISLTQGVTSLSATLSASKTFNYIWFYMASGVNVGFTLNLSVTESAKATSGEDTTLVLENTAEALLRRFDIKGDTEQTTYSGQNLYNVSTLGTGTYVTVDEDGWITMQRDNSADTTTKYINAWTTNLALLNTSTQYDIFTEVKSVSGDGGELAITSTASGSGQFTSWQTKQITEMQANTIYVVSPTTKDSFSGISNGLRTTVTLPAGKKLSITFRISVLAHGAQTSSTFQYEPFVGGTASPNPIYPQAIKTVTGENNIKIIGKNIFNYTNLRGSYGWYGGLHTTIDNDGSVTVTGKPEWDYVSLTYNMDITNLLEDGSEYSIWQSETTDRSMLYLQVAAHKKLGGTDWLSSRTFIVNKTVYDSYVATLVTTSQSLWGDSSRTITSRYQISKGQVDQFEPYQEQSFSLSLGSMELCKIGDYQDYFYKSEDKWYKHKVIGKMTLDGDINWTAHSTAHNFYNNNIPVGGAYGNIGITYIESARPVVAQVPYMADFNTAYSNMNYAAGLKYGNGKSELVIRDIRFSTAADLKTWLTSNPETFYFVLAAPVEEEITDETLKSQLESTRQAHAYRHRTYISAIASTGNAPHIISAEALANADGTITNSGNIYSKPKLTVFGSGNIGVYLNGVQMFEIALGDEQYITIDTAALEAYKDTTDNLKNRLVTGDYQNFAFKVGDNMLTFSGTVTECVVENYSRWL